jgi:hypothetical protein
MREKRPQATACLPVCQREEDEGVDLRIDAREGGGGRTELPERAEEFHPALHVPGLLHDRPGSPTTLASAYTLTARCLVDAAAGEHV